MMKRNDGYTLAYVVVVLGVMATVALATMTLALMPQKNQHLALERMQEKYAAQGYVEQVVAQLEHEVLPLDKIQFDSYVTSANISLDKSTGIITLTATEGNTTIVAEIILTPRNDYQTQVKDNNGNVIESEMDIEAMNGYEVTYLSYTTTVEKEVAES